MQKELKIVQINVNDYNQLEFNSQRMVLKNDNLTCRCFIEEETDYSDVILTYRNQAYFNPFYVCIKINQTMLHPKVLQPKEHSQSYHIEHDTFVRETIYEIDGVDVTIGSERFFDEKNNIIYLRYKFQTSEVINIELYHGLIAEVGNQNISIEEVNGDQNQITVRTNQPDRDLLVFIDRDFRHKNKHGNRNLTQHFSFRTEKDRIYTLTKFIGIGHLGDKMMTLMQKKLKLGFDVMKEKHIERQKNTLYQLQMDVFNNDKLDLLVKYCKRHLLQTKGTAIDKDIILTSLLPFKYYMMFDRDKARKYLKDKIAKLPKAKKAAKELNKAGAFFSNVSDDCLELITSASIIYAFNLYIEETEDISILVNGGLELIYQLLLFFVDYSEKDEFSNVININNVTNIDKSIMHINNHTLTNYLIKHSFYVFKSLLKLVKKFYPDSYQIFVDRKTFDHYVKKFNEVYTKLYIPKPNSEGIIYPYQNYLVDLENQCFDVVNKQIQFTNDHLLIFHLFEDLAPNHTINANATYWKKQHYSSLINDVLQVLSIASESPNQVYENMMRFASLEKPSLLFTDKVNIDIASIVLWIMIHRFSDFKKIVNQFTVDSKLPKSIRRLEYDIYYRRYLGQIKIKRNSAKISWK